MTESRIQMLERLGAELAAAEARANAPDPAPWWRRRVLRVAILSAAGAASLIVIGVLRSSDVATGPAGSDSFSALSALAAEQPAGLQHVEWTSELRYQRPSYWAQGAQYPDEILSTLKVGQWADADVKYEESVDNYEDVGPRTLENQSLMDRKADLFCYSQKLHQPDSVTGFTDRCSYLSLALSPGETNASLPTDPGELRQVLEDELREPPKKAAPADQACDVVDNLSGVTVPMSITAPGDRTTLIVDLRAADGYRKTNYGSVYYPPIEEQLFTRTTGLLADPTSTPELRSAVFEVMAGLENAHLAGDSTDRLGRAAKVIEYSSPAPTPDSTRYSRDQVFVDPDTSQVLELRTSVIGTGGGEQNVLGTYDRLFKTRDAVDSLPPSADDLVKERDRVEATCES